MPDKVPECLPDRMPADLPDNMPEDMLDRMPDGMPEDLPDNMPEDMPDRIPDGMPEDMPEDMPEHLPEDMPEHLPENKPGRMSEDMPDRMPDRMPENMSDRMPEDLPVTKCINVMVGITRSKVILFLYLITPQGLAFYEISWYLFCCILKLKSIFWGPKLQFLQFVAIQPFPNYIGFKIQDSENFFEPMGAGFKIRREVDGCCFGWQNLGGAQTWDHFQALTNWRVIEHSSF